VGVFPIHSEWGIGEMGKSPHPHFPITVVWGFLAILSLLLGHCRSCCRGGLVPYE